MPETHRRREIATALSVAHRLRRPRLADGAEIWRLVHGSTLDLNSPYAYLMVCRDFASTCVVAEGSDRTIDGFISAYLPPDRPRTLFVWQVAVADRARRHGLGGRMLDALKQRLGERVRFLEANVTRSNGASLRLFESFARRAGTEVQRREDLSSELFPDRSHDPELMLRIGPWR